MMLMQKVLKRLLNIDTLEISAIIVLTILIGAISWLFWNQHQTTVYLSQEIDRLRLETASTTAQLGAVVAVLTDNLTSTQQQALELQQTLSQKQQEIAAIQTQVGTISGTVTTLDKLSKTDPELLQKYSKVYFLNEHFVPERLSLIDKQYLYDESRPQQFHTRGLPYLTMMLNGAKGDGITIYVKSAYRSFDEQKYLKTGYSMTYGAGTANSFSADQGYSEHQLGTTADLITTGLGGQLSGFEKTTAYTWLQNNAHKYGFTLSYPANNSYYIFEPWHWRYVGVKLATDLFNSGKHFYDLEQREIDQYLVNIFD
jgi:LAS superfamily LD-carboxypeptidase LdcB